MRSAVIASIICMLGFTLTTYAQEFPHDGNVAIVSAYRSYKDIDNVAINVPTVLEVPFVDDFIERFDFAVLDTTTHSFEPYYFRQKTLTNETPVSVNTNPFVPNAYAMVDGNPETYADFFLPDNVQGQVSITVSSAHSITSSGMTLLLGDNVTLPTSVEIHALVDGRDRIVVAKRAMDRTIIGFPQTTSDMWRIVFTYDQPLRIGELRLSQDNATVSQSHAVRFLAQPRHTYRIYFNPDRPALPSVGEAGNLAMAQDAVVVAPVLATSNPDYSIADTDHDGIPDIRDNCISVGNTGQEDKNNNRRGDACDDFDQDGLINVEDNCIDNPNSDQLDTDGDGIGDVCDKEESRITERYPWLPWAGIGFAALVLVALFILTAYAKPVSSQEEYM